jgi:6-phospho-beta-glucosidase
MTPKLAVLGGSTPFTVGLIDALQGVADRLPAHTLILHGRHGANLQLVERYAQQHLGVLGWRVQSTMQLEQALAGATQVVHQIRYSGLERRLACEEFCARHGVGADETFGPAALLCALLSVPALRTTCLALRRDCPEAWVLNLTNPLSTVTALMLEAGVARCVGLCELPWVTVQETGRLLDLPIAELQWAYRGLNHRGFIYHLRYHGRDLLVELSPRLADRSVLGIGAGTIAALEAIPLKYFQLVQSPGPTASGRAAFLIKLRERILNELRSSVATSPVSLCERYLAWYPQSVVPMLIALHDAQPSLQIVNVMRDDGLVWEVPAMVCRDGVQPMPQPPCNSRVATWLQIFARHEQAFLKAVEKPSAEHIRQALVADPSLSEPQAELIAPALWEAYQAQGAIEGRRDDV